MADTRDFSKPKVISVLLCLLFHFNVLFILYKGTDYEKENKQRRI